MEWRKRGLDAPETVTTATESYRADQDVLAEFIESRCVIGAEYKVDKDTLYREYIDWTDSIRLPNGDRLGVKAFSRRVNADPQFGIKQVSNRGRKIIYGLGLPADGF